MYYMVESIGTKRHTLSTGAQQKKHCATRHCHVLHIKLVTVRTLIGAVEVEPNQPELYFPFCQMPRRAVVGNGGAT